MKKLLILTLAGGLALTATAQKTSDHRRIDDNNHQRGYYTGKKPGLERKIDNINNSYNSQVSYVRNNPHLKNREKNRKIKQLEKERRVAIQQCRESYSRKYKDGMAKDNRHHDRRGF